MVNLIESEMLNKSSSLRTLHFESVTRVFNYLIEETDSTQLEIDHPHTLKIESC